MIRFIHSADLHIDSPMEMLTGEKAKLRREEMRSLPEKICSVARDNNADFIILAGDIFDNCHPYKESITAFEKAMQDYEKPVFIVCGNHDHYSAGGVWDKLNLPSNVHIFRNNALECAKTATANIYGASCLSQSDVPDLAGFSPERESDRINILAYHGDICRAMQNIEIDYIAMGHIHKPSGVQKLGETYLSYCGCAEGRGFDECGSRSINLVEMHSGHCEVTPICVSARETQIITADVTGSDVTEIVTQTLSQINPKNIYRIILKGHCRERITQARFAKLTAQYGIFSATLRDETLEVLPDWNSDENSLRYKLTKIAQEKMASAENEAEREKIERALYWATAAMQNGEEPWELIR